MINKRYDIVKKIGQGRSSVFLCRDTHYSNNEIAIKVLPAGANEYERAIFRKEFFTLQKLDHPSIIRALEIGTILEKSNNDEVDIESDFITLEYFPSSELLQSELINDEKSFKLILKQLCSVLYYLHQSNYIYYDLKPENILVSGDTGSPIIKLIDLGLAHLKTEETKSEIKGTAFYIAPELLKNEEHDHKVDLYSLGMLLYRIIYKKFPFDFSDELSIYKAHIENEFSFPDDSKFSKNYISVVKKLLAKNPAERYQNALQVLADLSIKIEDSITNYLLPVKVFSGRSDTINILSTYINDKTSSEVFTLKGFEGAGKTAVINAISESYDVVVKVSSQKGVTGIRFLKYFLKEILYTKVIYQKLGKDDIEKIISLIDETDSMFLKEFPKIATQISQKSRFILLFDDFNLLDDFSFEVLRTLIPIFQVDSVKIILAETADHPYRSSELNNVKDILLSSFTDVQVTEFVNKSYSKDFPSEELITLIFKFSDFLPGSIITFIKDLLLLNLIRYLPSGIEIHKDEKAAQVLKSSQEVLFDFRISKLTKAELKVVQMISAMEVTIDLNTLADLIEIPQNKISDMIQKFQVENILRQFTSDSSLIITSEGFKKHIYNSINNKSGFHLFIAERIKKNLKNFNRNELARQFELAGKFELCYEIYWNEVEEIERYSAYAYMKKIIEHLLTLPLNDSRKTLLNLKLTETYFKLSDYRAALGLIESLNNNDITQEQMLNIRMIEGSSLVASGEFEEARKVFNKLLKSVSKTATQNEILIELAYADFEQQLYDEAIKICSTLLKGDKLTPEQKGRSHNLLAMCYIYKSNDVDSALAEFIKAGVHFKNADLPRRVAGIEVNVGNIFNILGHYQKAEEHWNKASEINKSVGNLEQEGLILLNAGIYYFSRSDFENAVESYKQALKIFLSLGNYLNQGLVHYNLAEVYLVICEYQNALNSLQMAKKIFEENENKEELSEVLYLFGKFYYTLGHKEKLTEIMNRFTQLLETDNQKSKQSDYLTYLEKLRIILEGDVPELEELILVRETFKESDEKNKYLDVNFTIIKQLIDSKQYSKALNEINDETFLEIINQNSILLAHRAFFLAKISANLNDGNLQSPVEYLENAYELLKDESITDVTWKILLALSEIYFDRGNLRKAKSYSHYAEGLINFIIENIQSAQLMKSYSNSIEIKSALNKIKVFKSA